jgi:uncharacterized membrane protein YadS
MAEKKKSPLLTIEDWWTVWFGLVILVVATVFGLLYYSDAVGTWYKVPKLGKWVESPVDAFYKEKKTKFEFKKGVTLAELTEAINEKKPMATAEIVAADGGVQLRIASTRDGKLESISVSPLLIGGADLDLTKEDPDPRGLGARAYVSQVFDDTTVQLGEGNVTIKAERADFIVSELLIALLLIGILTAFGVTVMGKSGGRYFLGFAIVSLLAVISFTIANQKAVGAKGLGYALWALVIGLFISNVFGTPNWLKPGVKTEMYIKTGLVLLGAEILFKKILALGVPGLLIAWVVTPTVIIFMYLFGVKFLKMSSKALVVIIAAATSVCGVSAAIAAAGASRAKKEELTLAVGMTLIFTVLMMIFMPMIIGAVGMDVIVGAGWMGGTIDSTGAVVAAGAFLGPKAEAVAAVVKMVQNVLIGVVGFGIALFWVLSVERDPTAPRPSAMEIWYRFPKFIVGFIAASIIFSFILSPLFGGLFRGDGTDLVEAGVIKSVTNPLRGWFFCLAFVAIGLESNFRELASQMEGGKPMVLYIVGQSFNLILTLLMAWLAFGVLFPNVI